MDPFTDLYECDVCLDFTPHRTCLKCLRAYAECERRIAEAEEKEDLSNLEKTI